MDADKGEPQQPLVTIQTTRTVRVYTITEQEARSVDQQHSMASAAFAFGTLFFGMLANMWLLATPLDNRLMGVLVFVVVCAWAFGGWLWFTRRSLLKTIQRESDRSSEQSDP